MSKSCCCEKCVAACKGNPGWFLPGEAEKAAEFLGIPFDEFRSKYLIRDYWVGTDDGDVYVWAPRKKGIEEDRETASFSYPFCLGDCIFLDSQNRCGIHEVKPHECREVMPCDLGKAIREKIQLEWRRLGNPLVRT